MIVFPQVPVDIMMVVPEVITMEVREDIMMVVPEDIIMKIQILL